MFEEITLNGKKVQGYLFDVSFNTNLIEQLFAGKTISMYVIRKDLEDYLFVELSYSGTSSDQ